MTQSLSIAFGAPGGDNQSDEWSTPQHILDAIGPYDLDPCPLGGSEGLEAPWSGFVFMNPPYSTAKEWLKRISDHGNGIALIYARTDSRNWMRYVWPKANAILFLKGRLKFGGSKSPAPAPSALIGYGQEAVDRLIRCGLEGALMLEWITFDWS